MEIGRPGGATVERFFRLPFVKRDRIKDFLTSYEWLNGVLAEEVVGDSGALRGRVQTAPSGAGPKNQTLNQTSQGMLFSPLF